MKPNRELKPKGLDAQARDMFAGVAATIGVERVVAWGSRAKGYWHNASDYDVVVPFTHPTKAMREKAAAYAEQHGIKVDLMSGKNWLPADGFFVEAACE